MEEVIIEQEINNKVIRNYLNLKWNNKLAIDRVDYLINYAKRNPDGYDQKLGGFAIWNDLGNYKRIEVRDEMALHMVPAIHVDFMRSIIDYPMSSDKIDDVRSLSESVQYDNLRHELSASCHFVGANVATLYLAILVASGEKTVIEARRMYGPAIKSTLDPKRGYNWYNYYSKQIDVEPIDDGSIPSDKL